MLKELSDGKLPEELKLFSGKSDDGNEFKFHTMQNIEMLNKSNEHFIDYLSWDFAKEVLAKNKMKIHLDKGNIYYDNLIRGRAFTVLCMHNKRKLKNLRILN